MLTRASSSSSYSGGHKGIRGVSDAHFISDKEILFSAEFVYLLSAADD